MNYSLEEIAKAIKIINDICNNVDDCEDCPFSHNGDCGLLEDEPREWEIKNPHYLKVFD